MLADAWIFQPPLSPGMLTEMDFYMGLPRCDNRLVHVLQQHNYSVLDPAFAVHAVELDSLVRTQVLYNIQQTVVGTTQTLLLSDQFVF
jgi:esterase/lipase